MDLCALGEVRAQVRTEVLDQLGHLVVVDLPIAIAVVLLEPSRSYISYLKEYIIQYIITLNIYNIIYIYN